MLLAQLYYKYTAMLIIGLGRFKFDLARVQCSFLLHLVDLALFYCVTFLLYDGLTAIVYFKCDNSRYLLNQYPFYQLLFFILKHEFIQSLVNNNYESQI